MERKLLLVEDDPDIRMALVDDFEMENYEVDVAINGVEGLKMGAKLDYDIILLDIMLPELNGVEVCKKLRQAGIGTPIIMLTAKSQEIDKVVGLEVGADDYVTKPFSLHELHARVKAVLRRSSYYPQDNSETILKNGPFEMDFGKQQLLKDGECIHLTSIEFSLLRFLMENKQKVLSRDKILDEVWGEDVYITPRAVDTHVANLRRKIGDDQAESRWIIGIRGVGYKMTSQSDI